MIFIVLRSNKFQEKDNSRTDLLAKVVTTTPMVLSQRAYFQQIKRPMVKESSEIMQLDDESCWIEPLIDFLRDGRLPADWKATCKIKYISSKYLVYDGKLSKRSFSLPLRYLWLLEMEFAFKGGSWRDLWRPHRKKGLSIQVAPIGLLLADHATGCREIHNEMWCLLKECQHSTSPDRTDHSCMHSMTFCTMEDGYPWSIFSGLRVT